MPDLNLKGDDALWAGPIPAGVSPADGRNWFGISLGSNLIALAAVLVFVLSNRHGFESARKGEPQIASVVTVDSSEGILEAADTIDAGITGGDTVLQTDSSQQRMSESTVVESVWRTTASGSFTIQVSAWHSEWRAKEEAERLKDMGLDAFISRSLPDSVSRAWHRVRVGHYRTFADAKKIAEGMLDLLETGFTIERDN